MPPPPSHPGHFVPPLGPQPHKTLHITTDLRNLDTCRRGADRYATRSNVRGRRRTASNPSPAVHMPRTLIRTGVDHQPPTLHEKAPDTRAGTVRSSNRRSSGSRSATTLLLEPPAPWRVFADSGETLPEHSMGNTGRRRPGSAGLMADGCFRWGSRAKLSGPLRGCRGAGEIGGDRRPRSGDGTW
jgi:hypothetical protein